MDNKNVKWGWDDCGRLDYINFPKKKSTVKILKAKYLHFKYKTHRVFLYQMIAYSLTIRI